MQKEQKEQYRNIVQKAVSLFDQETAVPDALTLSISAGIFAVSYVLKDNDKPETKARVELKVAILTKGLRSFCKQEHEKTKQEVSIAQLHNAFQRIITTSPFSFSSSSFSFSSSSSSSSSKRQNNKKKKQKKTNSIDPTLQQAILYHCRRFHLAWTALKKLQQDMMEEQEERDEEQEQEEEEEEEEEECDEEGEEVYDTKEGEKEKEKEEVQVTHSLQPLYDERVAGYREECDLLVKDLRDYGWGDLSFQSDEVCSTKVEKPMTDGKEIIYPLSKVAEALCQTFLYALLETTQEKTKDKPTETTAVSYDVGDNAEEMETWLAIRSQGRIQAAWEMRQLFHSDRITFDAIVSFLKSSENPHACWFKFLDRETPASLEKGGSFGHFLQPLLKSLFQEGDDEAVFSALFFFGNDEEETETETEMKDAKSEIDQLMDVYVKMLISVKLGKMEETSFHLQFINAVKQTSLIFPLARQYVKTMGQTENEDQLVDMFPVLFAQ